MTTNDETRNGFTLKELFAVTFIIAAILFFCVLPFGRRGGVREAARRMQCTNNMKQILLALHNYHDTFNQFPMAMGGTGAGGNENRLNALIALVPFMESSSVYDQIISGSYGAPPGGPAPWDKTFPPWQFEMDSYNCPAAYSEGKDYQPTNYAFCIGDVTSDIHQLPKPRGAFAPGLFTRFDDITDGTSNTIAMAEMGTEYRLQVQGQYAVNLPKTILTDPGICWRTVDSGRKYYQRKVGLHDRGRGYNWVDGAAGPGLVNTILPPNSPSCAVGGLEAVDGVYSAGSQHPGGCLVAFVDGSVQFVSEEVDAGDSALAPPTVEDFADQSHASPFGAWGAMGTISGSEAVGRDDL
ncbi:DUF1559 family PulG-like putative transporter [Bremerella alba]|uniref:DUF1559 domain-containing protein n=1 Tax=Bremerella alba TaxID=980252 RepID=A0A7V8V4N0_9BACT|nr:DUF1559 domain-containing protein [Bremerella alba]MBA2114671.1 hypothetical protein [Bremerella alba]